MKEIRESTCVDARNAGSGRPTFKSSLDVMNSTIVETTSAGTRKLVIPSTRLLKSKALFALFCCACLHRAGEVFVLSYLRQ